MHDRLILFCNLQHRRQRRHRHQQGGEDTHVKLEVFVVYKQLVCSIVLPHSAKVTFPTTAGGTSMDEYTCSVMRTLLTDDGAKP
ncbi:hypothetical protein EG68_03203 [Paragonimus skrjabini miyazakii]|uniref:Uncharacterized protein n=1 Tax=Paragonimus skrjabini miyazakii TaxID=59628 RepID=A0A8S9Z8P2_9TREM|nr:hypothetical protein EG68_03203 [Paragonimus skrjabini miyazakii]